MLDADKDYVVVFTTLNKDNDQVITNVYGYDSRGKANYAAAKARKAVSSWPKNYQSLMIKSKRVLRHGRDYVNEDGF